MHIMHTMAWQRVHKMHGQSVPGSVYCAYKWGMSQTDDSPSLIGLGAGGDFFFCKRGLPSPNISANHMARILSTSYVHVHVHTRTVNVCAMLMISYVILKYTPYDWLKCNPRLQKKKNRVRARARCTWSVCSRLRLLHVQLWGVSQTNDLPLINQQPLIQMRYL